MTAPATVDAYIAALPAPQQDLARALRSAILAGAPNAAQSIRYGMPAFHLGGRAYLYFAVWKAHCGLYPIYGLPEALETRVAQYRAKTDTLQFPHKAPLPLDLITDLAGHKRAAASDN